MKLFKGLRTTIITGVICALSVGVASATTEDTFNSYVDKLDKVISSGSFRYDMMFWTDKKPEYKDWSSMEYDDGLDYYSFDLTKYPKMLQGSTFKVNIDKSQASYVGSTPVYLQYLDFPSSGLRGTYNAGKGVLTDGAITETHGYSSIYNFLGINPKTVLQYAKSNNFKDYVELPDGSIQVTIQDKFVNQLMENDINSIKLYPCKYLLDTQEYDYYGLMTNPLWYQWTMDIDIMEPAANLTSCYKDGFISFSNVKMTINVDKNKNPKSITLQYTNNYRYGFTMFYDNYIRLGFNMTTSELSTWKQPYGYPWTFKS